MNQQEYYDCMKLNGKYFDIHPHDIADNEDDRILQCIPYLPKEYRKLIVDYVKTTVHEFDILFAQFNDFCEHELSLYYEYHADQVIDDTHADTMSDLPF